MENASKALIIAASVLIAIMLMSFMVFMFRRFKTIAKDTETNLSELEKQAFNAKFIGYETGGTHSTADKFNIVQRAANGRTSGSKEIQYSLLFSSGGGYTNKDVRKKALVAASQSLNTAADVVTAINDAIDVNYQNSNGYLYGYKELQTCVEIIVDLSLTDTKVNNFNKGFRYLTIEPNKAVKAKYVYGRKDIATGGTNTQNRANNINSFVVNESTNPDGSGGNNVKVSDMLENLRETRLIESEGKTYSINKYYFFGQVFTSPVTNLVETVKFTLVRDDFTGYPDKTIY